MLQLLLLPFALALAPYDHEKIKRKLTGVEDPRETEVKSKVFSPRSLP